MTMMTKKARIERAREIIDRNDYGIPFNDDDLKEFSDITGCALRYACRAIDPNYATNDRHVVVLAYDWVEPQGWSWRKAIQIGPQDMDRHMRARVGQAMRSAIAEQIVEFAVMAEKACGECATTESLTVDHIWPPFSQIASAYIRDFGAPKIEEDNGSGFKFADESDERRWQDCHMANAKLGILCRSCNSKKGVRAAV
jgi:5-methylcytosine-specific restriction endonuclease McrA